jgi:hypothetical protein
VGDEQCARCHQEIAEKFRRHPMGRSLAPVESSPAVRTIASAGNPVRFDVGPFRYSIKRRDGHVIHEEAHCDEQGHVGAAVEHEVTYALGSGTRGISFLVEQSGRLFQSPIAWYGQKGTWDLAPGYQVRNRHFDRAIEPQCLFCHANHVKPIERTLGKYKEPVFRGYSIGCERCHGPGNLHVRATEQVGDSDVSIVNPRHLEPALREAVCEQCHLQADYRIERLGRSAFDYRPGLPLSTFLAVLERVNKRGNKAVGHVEQMHASRCFREGKGQLGCISCHDPHTVPSPEERISHYRRQCQTCHDQRPCSLPERERLARRPDDNCVACHMPVSSNTDIIHNATTDHRILRNPQASESNQPEPMTAGLPLEFFHAGQVDANERRSMLRELSIGLAFEARRLPEPSRKARLARQALDLLSQAIEHSPDDLVALRAQAQSLAMSGRAREALRAYDKLLERAPDYEQALDERVALALELEDRHGGLAPARRAVEVNPWSAEFHERLAHYQLESGDRRGALAEAGEALRLNPFLVFARQFRIQALLGQRDLQTATEELRILNVLNPADREARQIWFARERRKLGE